MSDVEILDYIQSHAPVDRFYLFNSLGGEVLVKYFDAAGQSWSIMEDDEVLVTKVVGFLRRSGVRVFNDFGALLKYEKETASMEN